SGTSTITVTARDAGGNVIGGASVVLTAGGAGNTLTPPSGTTDPTTGVLTATFSATGAGERTISATINSVAITQTAPLTVTAGDAVGNPVPGATVTLDASGVGNTLTQQAATTDASGRVTGTLSSTGAEMKTVSATLNGTLPLAETPTVQVLPGPAAALAFTVQPSNTMILGRISPPVRVTAFDAFGNMASGFADNVTIAIGTDPSLLGAHLGGTTSVPAVSGVATFDDLSIDQLGTGYTLIASVQGITTTSAPFDVTLLP